MFDKFYYVYIMTNNNNTVLYTSVTNDLIRRVSEHKSIQIKGFTAKYNISKLVYFEHFNEVEKAIAREKQIKAGSRIKKIILIEKDNTDWNDLIEGF